MKPILIISATKEAIAPFKKAAVRLGREVRLAAFQDFHFSGSRGARIFLEDEGGVFDLLDSFSLIFFRMVKHNMERVNLIVDYLSGWIPIIDRINRGGVYRATKAFQYRRLVENKLAVPPFIYGPLSYLYSKAEKSLGLPLIIKRSESWRGQYVYLMKSGRQWRDFVEKNKLKEQEWGRYYLAQRFVENDSDYRIIVLGGQVLGAIERKRMKRSEFRNNVYLGGVARKVNLEKKLLAMAVKAAQVCEIDVAGVDIIIDKKSGRPYILEVNRSPGFKGFIQATGIDVYQAIVEYLTKEARNDH